MKNKAVFISPLFNVIVGILIIIFKGDVLRWVAIALGAVLILYSSYGFVFSLKTKNNPMIGAYAGGIVVGVIAVVFSAALVDVVRFVFGGIFIVMGVIGLIHLSQVNDGEKIAVFSVIIAVVFLLIGVLIMLDAKEIYYFVGGLLILNGILDIIRRQLTHSAVKKSDKDNIIDAEIKDL